MTIALETRNLEKTFGGLRVTRDLSLKVEQGARHAPVSYTHLTLPTNREV